MSSASRLKSLGNASAVDVDEIPLLAVGELQDAIVDAVGRGCRISALYAADASPGAGRANPAEIWAVLADDADGRLWAARAPVETEASAYPSLTPRCPQAHLFEREIFEQWGLEPLGHPWLKPVRFENRPLGRRRGATGPTIGVASFDRVRGDEIHEVAVGPVHAGVIEPGHFRFQCHGEHVFRLEISLGYQHRGVERALVGGPAPRSIHYAETLSGDTTAGHAAAYCQAVEALGRCRVPPRAQVLRAVALELERVANHVGDLGALAGDVGYLPTASYCGRIRGDFLNLSAALCGSRFGRGMLRPGGTGFDLGPELADGILANLDRAAREAADAVGLLWSTPSVMARFEDTGFISLDECIATGLVGPAARACGAARDVRNDFPFGAFRFSNIPVSALHGGDVFARAYVRWLEIERSVAFVREQIAVLPVGPFRVVCEPPAPNRFVASLVEGWRGEICHAVTTDAEGRFRRYKVVDPSFHNWFGLALALRDQPISDFPLCNKSFNLSYCGFDL